MILKLYLEFLLILTQNVEKFAKITIMWGKIHKYLGVDIDYSSAGRIIFSMFDYIGKVFNEIP